MSRNYTINAGMLSQTVDGKTKVKLLPIEGVQGDVAVACEEDGWTRTADDPLVLTREQGGGVTATLDLREESLTIRASVKKEVVGKGYDLADREDIGMELARQDVERQRDELGQAASAAVLQAEGGVREALGKAISRAYVTALERKASQMGDVESVQRGVGANGAAEVTIKVRV